tara:strand:+ start:2067 stop:2276 length:210 start_codon:yes stop_codon:yes gene_type:complete
VDGDAYDDDEDDEWAGDDTAWNDDNEPEDEADGKDESTAYLEFLNEEVSFNEYYLRTCSLATGTKVPEP